MTAREKKRDTPVEARLPEPIKSVALDDESACAVGRGGTLYCWGAYWHQSGDDPHINVARPSPEKAAKGTFEGVVQRGGLVCPYDAKWIRCRTFGDEPIIEKRAKVGAAIWSSGTNACTLDRSGQVSCGFDERRRVVPLPPVRLLAGHGGSECAATTTGRVVCWGELGRTLHPLIPRTVR